MDIPGLADVPLWLMLVVCLFLLLYVYGTWTHSVWVSQGVPGPKPWPLLGNTVEVHGKSNYHVFPEWQEKYGSVVGYYLGVSPVLAITDLDMVQEVMLKQFNNFSERNVIRGLGTHVTSMTVISTWGGTWKRIRSLVTPAFTVVKLKLMNHYISRCSKLLVTNIEGKARSGQPIDIKSMCQAFSLDVIAGTGFGLETNSLSQEDEPFTRHCREVIDSVRFAGNGRFLLYLLPPIPKMFGFFDRSFFFNAVEKMIDERLEEEKRPSQNSEKPADMLQMMVDNMADPEHIVDSPESQKDTKSHQCLTKDEVLAQGFTLMLAAFETTATSLQYLTYNLALHPHVQERIFEEIREQLGDAEPTYKIVSHMKYLDANIRETLRLFAPAAVTGRRADKATTIKGVHIPADCQISIPLYCILHDPEYFPDPEVFNPDRFLPENAAKMHPVLSELVFGYGPRKCLGMRLALLELKTAAVYMLRRCRFVKCAETPDKVTLGKSLNFATPNEVIMVKAELRDT